MLLRGFALALLLSSCGWADSGRLYLHAVRFQPRSEQRPVSIEPGASISTQGAERAAAKLREQLIGEGYREAKVEAVLAPAGFRRADLKIHVERGRQYRIREVRVSSVPGLDAREIQRVFRHLPDSDAALEPALARVRSIFIAHGYLDAEVNLGRVERDAQDATLTLETQPGTRYAVDVSQVCRGLMTAQRRSEKRGVMDFRPRLVIDRTLAIRPLIEEGPPFTVGRIEFRGNHRFSDTTLRRAIALEEGALFDAERLRRSVARLNDLKLFEPLAGDDIEIRRDEAAHVADITFQMREKPRGSWALSGPVIPAGIAGPFSASITSRLPAWGRGLLEASTWYASFNLIGLSRPVARLIPFAPRSGLLPLFSLERPLLPGQRWISGFAISPQLGWKSGLAGYGLAQTHQTIRSLLRADLLRSPALVAPVDWSSPVPRPAKAGALICEPPKPRWSKVRTVAASLNEFLLGVRPF